MRKILTYIISLVALLGFAGCHAEVDDISYVGNDNYIKLYFTPFGDTRGTIADNESESYLSHLDVIIYKQLPDGVSYEGFYQERVSVSDTPDGVATIHRTKEDFELDAKYKVYVIANSDVAESVYYQSGSIIDHDKFLKLDQTNNKIHLSGIDFGNQNFEYPQMFLMDGVAYMGSSEPAQGRSVVINDGTTDDVTLKVTLRRAAAKIIVTIKPGDKVTFSPDLMAKSQGYLLRNMPVRSTLTAEGGYPNNENGLRPYWMTPTISQSPYFQLLDDGNGDYKLQITAYCYSHSWLSSEIFHKGTSLVVMLPISYKEDVDSDPIEYINNYYQISFSKREGDNLENSYHLIKRNTLYDLRVTLNAPGAEDYTSPEEIEDLKYFTAPWETMDIPVSGEAGVKYLKVNKNKLIMYDNEEDLESIYFSSSSPVTVTYVPESAYYFDKYNTKKTLGSNSDEVRSIKGIVDPVATSGNIGIQSAVPTNNTIRYFQLQVKNEEGLTEIIDVAQYPLIYITNSLPWYSYRDDYYYRTTGGHSWDRNITNGMASGDSPTTYQYYGDHVVSISKINSVNETNKTATYTYSHNHSGSNSSWTCSKVRGNASSGGKYAINYYYFTYSRSWSLKTASCETHNVRNYKVRVMASSEDYILARPNIDEYGYTAGDDNNAKLVSPSFVIASRLGAVLSTYSGLSGMSAKKKLVVFADHCKNYVEVDDVNDDKKAPVEVYDNWRLPTEAELKIIMDLQGGDGENADAIDFLLNGGYYMSASGPVFNPKNTSNVKEANDKWSVSDVAIRCVRDAYE
ncbi:MAG: hypothetical protein J6U93_08320 [Alistipes sp.]|nr:hypothetical protein [Alistipes sp.]